MKHYSIPFVIAITLSTLICTSFTPTAFAAKKKVIHRAPYNALAATLKSNTTKGVFNATDNIQKNVEVKGLVWGLNGSTFLVQLPKNDSGYNILLTKDTVIRKNGKSSSKKDLIKGKAVTVVGDLDKSTYTLAAATVDLGTYTPIVPSTRVTEPVTEPTTKKQPEVTQETKTPPTTTETNVETKKNNKQQISRTLKLGNKNADVAILQEKLVELGLLSKNAATGYYGSQTVKAVKAFQKAHKLQQAGSVGTKTLTLLNK